MRYLLFATAIFAASIGTANAVDFTQEVKTFDGKSFTDQTGAPSPQILLDITSAMLMSPPAGTSEDERKKRFWLAVKIHDHPKDAALTLDELALVKKATFDYPQLSVAGQATRLIDPNFVPAN